MRILVIEDDRKAAELLARGLREERFVVDIAYSGEEGDEMASTTDYDVIVLPIKVAGHEGAPARAILRKRTHE